jgi:malate synthase
MDEILYELRDHMAGLNCGRWDYIFSFIKRFRAHPAALFPDRSEVSMSQPFMHAYSLLAIQTCHKRGAHAIGGISAQIPIKNDPEANSVALEKVREDKRREATDGHDGTWVAHPGLVAIALEEFDRLMPEPNQVNNLREDIVVTAEDLLEIPAGNITEAGLRQNISVGVQYMASWLSGNGCVPLYNLMEDAATAEISRTQLWQWIHHPDASLDDGRKVTVELFKAMLTDELDQVQQQLGQERFEQQRFPLAIKLFDEITTNPELEEFLTLRAYKHLESS